MTAIFISWSYCVTKIDSDTFLSDTRINLNTFFKRIIYDKPFFIIQSSYTNRELFNIVIIIIKLSRQFNFDIYFFVTNKQALFLKDLLSAKANFNLF